MVAFFLARSLTPVSLGLSIPKSRQYQSPVRAGRIGEVAYTKHPAQGWPETSELISDLERKPWKAKSAGSKWGGL